MPKRNEKRQEENYHHSLSIVGWIRVNNNFFSLENLLLRQTNCNRVGGDSSTKELGIFFAKSSGHERTLELLN